MPMMEFDPVSQRSLSQSSSPLSRRTALLMLETHRRCLMELPVSFSQGEV
jgi:hypothetical protein